jgi:hypothetical protein
MKWSNEELDYLKENAFKMSHDEISKNINRTEPAIRNKCYELGLVNINKYWTNEEVNLLKEFYLKAGESAVINLTKFAKQLNRDKSNVCRKAKELGLPTSINRKHSDERMENLQVAHKNSIKKNGHPRGMLGKNHSDEFKQNMSSRVKKEWANPNSKLNSEECKQKHSDYMTKKVADDIRMRRGYSRGNQGKRQDLNNMYVRSSWEANYARYLNFLQSKGEIFKWKYEADTFWFEKIKRGVRSYLPDFKIWDKQDSTPYYVEVKGWMDDKSKTKLKRMSKYYPSIKVIVFGVKEYKELTKFEAIIPNWE